MGCIHFGQFYCRGASCDRMTRLPRPFGASVRSRPDPNSPKWVSARHLRQFLAQARAAGVEVDALLEQAGLVRERLTDPDYRAPVPAIESMLAAICHKRAQPLIGLHAARSIQPGAFGPLGYLAQSCTTVADLLDVVTRYSGLLSNVGATSVAHIPGGAEVRWEPRAGGRLFQLQAADYVVATFIVAARQLIPEQPDLPLAVNLPRERPDAPQQLQEYRSFFRCPVYFERPLASVVLSSRALQTRLAHGDAVTKDLLERHAADLLRLRTPVPALEDEVRHLIRVLMVEGVPRLEVIARQLGLSNRSLRRKLLERGSGYRSLLDQMRLEMATRQLRRSSDSATAISEQLGFSSRQAFLRWFKHRTGKAPGQYRLAVQPEFPPGREARR
jgi:AraC-like DNA-binding protein